MNNLDIQRAKAERSLARIHRMFGPEPKQPQTTPLSRMKVIGYITDNFAYIRRHANERDLSEIVAIIDDIKWRNRDGE